MNTELLLALELLEKEKGISKEYMIDALEQAIISAYRKNYSTNQNVRIDMNLETGDFAVFAQKVVVEEVVDPDCEYPLSEALKLDADAEVEDILEFPVTPRNFGRIAAQNAKQVIVQKIREAERANVFNEYSDRENDIVSGMCQRKSKNDIIVDLGKTDGVLPEKEQVKKENYSHGTKMKFYVTRVDSASKGAQVKLSRSHPGLVKRLFELEVPEISDGVVEILNVAREAGARSKIAVKTNDENVDPIGACVGQRGSRVNAVVDELNGEKIDIITYSEEPEEFIAASLSPSPVIRVDILGEKEARAIVPDAQLSLAIGAAGQNARLAAKLTGWKIDIKSESEFMAELEEEVKAGRLSLELDDESEQATEGLPEYGYDEESEENEE